MIEGEKLGIFAIEKNNLPIESFDRGLRFAEDVAAERSKGFFEVQVLGCSSQTKGDGFQISSIEERQWFAVTRLFLGNRRAVFPATHHHIFALHWLPIN